MKKIGIIKESVVELKNNYYADLYTKAQYDVREYIKSILEARNIPYIEFDGNLWKIDKPGPVFVSHMDTVGESAVSIGLKTYKDYNGDLWLERKFPSVLGADDKAGLSAILNHADELNFIFTRDEEIGYIGAKSLRQSQEWQEAIEQYVTCFIELDRREQYDSVGAIHGYCQKDLLNAINAVMKKKNMNSFQDSHGAFTDIDAFVDLKPGINLSIGYENAHTQEERLNLIYWDSITSILPDLHEALQDHYEIPERLEWNDRRNTWNWRQEDDYDYYDPWFDEDYETNETAFYCDQCNNYTEKIGELYSIGIVLCDECMINLKQEIEQELRRIEQ